MNAQQELLAMIKNKQDCAPPKLMSLFEQLEPAPADFMIGQWHGGTFDSTRPNPIRWYGKRFVSASHVEPMLCQNEDGSVYAWEKWGPAQLREVKFGDKVQACLIYDKQPMMDYFRKVTEDIVIGLGDIKGMPLDFFFWLEREK